MATSVKKPQQLTYQGTNPFIGSGQGGGPVTAKPLNDYTTTSFATVPGPYDKYRDQLAAQNPGIPRSFIDDEIDNLNSGRTRAGNAANNPNLSQLTPDSPNALSTIGGVISQEWSQEPNRQRYITTDQTAAQTKDVNNTLGGATRAQGQIATNLTNGDTAFNNQYVVPALKGVQTAAGAQVTGDRAAEGQLQGIANQYTGTLSQDEALRMQGIGTTNAATTDLANQYSGAVGSTNASNNQFASQFIPIANQANSLNSGLANNLFSATNSTNAANSQLGSNLLNYANTTNANQTGLYNTLAGQAAGVNSNQTQLFNQLAAQASQSNNALNAANSTFQGQLGNLNDQQMAADTAYQQQLSQMNGLDRASLARYMGETDPLMSPMQAQASDPQDVANMQDVVGRYKDLSTPQVTDQERLVAELARRKFESDDQSNREAVMQQLAGRGLRSGGLVVAGTQAANQQTASDRQMAELGLNAQAQQRAMQGLAGYSSSSNALRNADDAMKNFQDQYAQNDAVRRGNLSGQREGINLAETNQETGRYTDSFNANTTSLNNNTTRDQMGFDASRGTINDNYNRDASVFDAGTTTNNNNYARDQSVFNAGTTTNTDNYNRQSDATKTGYTINQGNLGNTQYATNTGIGVNNDNATRSRQALTDNITNNQTNLGNTAGAIGLQYGTVTGNDARTQAGLNSGETAAGNIANAQSVPVTTNITNLGNEASTAQGVAGTMLGGAGTFHTISSSDAGAQQQGIDDMLARLGLGAATKVAAKAT